MGGPKVVWAKSGLGQKWSDLQRAKSGTGQKWCGQKWCGPKVVIVLDATITVSSKKDGGEEDGGGAPKVGSSHRRRNRLLHKITKTNGVGRV